MQIEVPLEAGEFNGSQFFPTAVCLPYATRASSSAISRSVRWSLALIARPLPHVEPPCLALGPSALSRTPHSKILMTHGRCSKHLRPLEVDKVVLTNRSTQETLLLSQHLHQAHHHEFTESSFDDIACTAT